MASDLTASAGDEGREPRRQGPGSSGVESGGFFHVYKRGQGYWTRMGSAAAAALIAALTVQFLYTHLNVWLVPLFASQNHTPEQMAHAISMTKIATVAGCALFLLLYGLLVFYLLNKPQYADFLIATDSEMKKVNWTSRKELLGSTKIVILFMFLIAAMLFAFDLFFGYLFFYMDVLKYKPF